MTTEYKGILGLLNIINDNLYECNYPTDPDTENIKTAHEMVVSNECKYARILNTDSNIYEVVYYASRLADILHNIIIVNKNKIADLCFSIDMEYIVDHNTIDPVLCTGSITLFNIKIPDTDCYEFRPFKFGIPIVSLYNSNILFSIKSTSMIDTTNCPIIISKGLFLNTDDRMYAARNKIMFDNVIMENGYWYTEK